ncbi:MULTISPECIES: CIA30 family protein [unclassified Sulfitobacter]|uniref:CIA30 family protein n=1 Tax=unclassified Sulfitobacter TaxID=196795 RepID=UPI003744DB9B
MMQLTPDWEFVSDTVMGGVSSGAVAEEIVGGRSATVLRGTVSLENNGGFIQMAFDLHEDGADVDVSAWDGIEMDVYGDGGTYDVRLRTARLTKPWQSFRADFVGYPTGKRLRFLFVHWYPIGLKQSSTQVALDASGYLR